MSDHREALARAHAAQLQIIGYWQEYQAAILLGDVVTAEALRVKAHDTLDGYFDAAQSLGQTLRTLSRD